MRTLGRELTWAVREHAALLGLVLAYELAAWLYFAGSGRMDAWRFEWADPFYMQFVVTGSAARLLLARLRQRGASPLWTGRAVAGAVIVFALVRPFKSTFSSVKQTLGTMRGFTWDATLAGVDRWLHGGRQPWEWAMPLLARPASVRALDLIYWLWFPLLAAFLLWAAWTPRRELRRRALLAMALVWIVCGSLIPLAMPSAGPCYFKQVTATPGPYGPLWPMLDAHQAAGQPLAARYIQRELWRAATDREWMTFGGIAAFPSVHVAVAVLLALIGWRVHPAIGLSLGLFAVLTFAGSVVLGWHYAVDGYVAAALAVGLWHITSRDTPRAGAPEPSDSPQPRDLAQGQLA